MVNQKYILRTCPNTECEIVQWLVNKSILSTYLLGKKKVLTLLTKTNLAKWDGLEYLVSKHQ